MRNPSVHHPAYKAMIQSLVDARHAAQLTQEEVSAQMGRVRNFMTKVETRERRLDFLEVLQIAEIVGADPHKLLSKVLAVRKKSAR